MSPTPRGLFAPAALLVLLAGLLTPTLAVAQAPPKVEFELDGYWRTRAVAFFNLFDQDFPQDGARRVDVFYLESVDQIPQQFQDSWAQTHPTDLSTGNMIQGYCHTFPAQCRRQIHNPGRTHWISQRGRFEPIVRFGDRIKLQATIDVFDNVLWGDNENLASTPLFAGDPSATQVDGALTDTIAVKRLWVEWTTAFGLVRLGRQPSNWGLGLLANDGNEFKNDFGDSYDGSSYDRIIFATRPISLVRGVAAILSGKPTPDTSKDPLIIAIGFDKLVESSSITFRKQLTDDESVADENADGDSFVRRSPIWLSDTGDDVWEAIFMVMFKRTDWQIKNQVMDLTAGMYVVHRWQKETASKVWIPDFYLDWKLRGFFVKGEMYLISGKTQAIAPQWGKETTANIFGTAWRAGYENSAVTALFEIGHASGDDVLLQSENDVFKGRALHSDYNVGLILYEQMLAQRTADAFVNDPDLQGLWSNGGVYNSTYINPRFKYRPGDITEFRLGVVAAWVDEVDGAIIPFLEREDGTREEAGAITETKFLGIEIDLGVHFSWADGHVVFSAEGGYMHAGPRMGRMSKYAVPGESATLYTKAQYDRIKRRVENVGTLQARLAFIF